MSTGAEESAKWYIMRVHNMAFSRTREALEALKVRYFVPETYKIVEARGRKVKQLVPALKDFFFIRSTYGQLTRLVDDRKLPLAFYYSHTSHVQNDALCVRDAEMDAFISASQAFDRMPDIQPFGEIRLKDGDRVRVLSGPFEGIEGFYTQPRRGMRKHLVLTLSNLLTVTLQIHPTDLLQTL